MPPRVVLLNGPFAGRCFFQGVSRQLRDVVVTRREFSFGELQQNHNRSGLSQFFRRKGSTWGLD